MPIGACLARGEAASLFSPGNHGSTFGGNPIACAAAHAVMDVIEQENLESRALALGERIQKGFEEALKGNNKVKEVRGAGLMLAVELNEDLPDLVTRALAEGLLINVTQGNIVRMLPPLNMTDAEADELVAKVAGLINL
jgi:acetylornithine aminotransferase